MLLGIIHCLLDLRWNIKDVFHCYKRTFNIKLQQGNVVYLFFQCLDTTDAQRQWIINHLGHTMDVHMTHYRQTSDILERVDVAKMLLIQDTNQVGKFVGRKIDDINLEGMHYLSRIIITPGIKLLYKSLQSSTIEFV